MPEGRPKTASDVVQNMDKTRTQALLEILESGQGLHYLDVTWYLRDGDLATRVLAYDKINGWHTKFFYPGVTFSFFIRMAQDIDDEQLHMGLNTIALNKLNTPKTQRS